jgi:hypothetical protein
VRLRDGARPNALRQQNRLAIQAYSYSGAKIKEDSRRQSPSYTIKYSLRIGMPIWRKSLQTLEQHPRCHERSSDDKRAWPKETEHQCETEIASQVIELPTEPRSDLPIGGAKGSEYQQQGQRSDTASPYRGSAQHFGRASRDVLRL